MQYNGTSTNVHTPDEPLTVDKLRKLMEQIPDYALLTAQPVVEGDDCLMMRRNEWMPPGCRYVLIVAPDKLHAVARRLCARVSSRLGDGNFYEFYVPKEKRERWLGGILNANITA
jgi:hypothetical protein